MVEELYVSFETAKLLKEKGFDESCRYYYVNNGNLMFTEEYLHNSEIKYGTYPSCVCTAPTQQMAMCWLREVHNISIELWTYKGKWCVNLARISDGVDIYVEEFDTNEYSTYEEAAEAGIKYCLENLI